MSAPMFEGSNGSLVQTEEERKRTIAGGSKRKLAQAERFQVRVALAYSLLSPADDWKNVRN